MNVTTVYATTVGPTAPVLINDFNLSGITELHMKSPTVFGSVTGAGNARWHYEITFDQPDGNGNWPSPAHWVYYNEDPGNASNTLFVSRAFPIKMMYTAVRANIETIDASTTLAFAVVQGI